MKRILRTTINEIKRILFSTGFWLSVGLAVVILLTNGVYEDSNGTVYTVLSAAFIFGIEDMPSRTLNVQQIFSMHGLIMYGPLLTALSFVPSLCEEQKYGVRRYMIFKTDKNGYVLSKALSAILVSGLTFLISSFIFLLFLYWKYPLMSVQDASGFDYWLEYYFINSKGSTLLLFEWFGEHAYCLLQLVGIFIYGVFCGFIGFLCTAFFSNVYLAVCIPFFLGYIYYSITQALVGRFMEGSISNELYKVVYSYVSPQGYMNFWNMQEYLPINMIVLAAVWIVAIIIHMIRIEKISDCGVNR